MRKLLLTSMILFGVGPAAGAADIAPGIIDPYLRIQSALAADKMEAVKADAAEIATAAASIGADAKALETAARELERAGNLKATRTAFGKLSDALIRYADRTNSSLGADLVVAYCPMVRRSWVQRGTAIRNPYYGPQMLECGEVKKTK